MASASETDIQNRIVQFISDELGIPPEDIDVETNLGTYGLESVAASKLVGLLDKDLNLGLSEIIVFEFPTIASLSGEIQKLSLAEAS
ncbi:MAG: acyl carrier protein [Methyloligella sp. ZOD6]